MSSPRQILLRELLEYLRVANSAATGVVRLILSFLEWFFESGPIEV